MDRISPMLCVRNMKESIDFYQKVLGFKLGTVVPDVDAAQYADVQKDGTTIMLVPASFEGISSRARLGTGVYIYMQIDTDIDAYHARLKRKGVKIPFDIREEPYGIRDFTVEDNSGYRLVFYNPSKKAKVCLSCGMPMTNPGDFGGGNAENYYCVNCSKPDGSLKSREEVFQGMVTFMMSSQKLDRKAAEIAAKDYMEKMPAWS